MHIYNIGNIMKMYLMLLFLFTIINLGKTEPNFLSEKDSLCLHCISNKILSLQSIFEELVKRHLYRLNNKDKVSIELVNKETGRKNNVLPFNLIFSTK